MLGSDMVAPPARLCTAALGNGAGTYAGTGCVSGGRLCSGSAWADPCLRGPLPV
jgi:hypothetical protein